MKICKPAAEDQAAWQPSTSDFACWEKANSFTDPRLLEAALKFAKEDIGGAVMGRTEAHYMYHCFFVHVRLAVWLGS